MRRCPACNLELPNASFDLIRRGPRGEQTTHGRRETCRRCTREQRQAAAAGKVAAKRVAADSLLAFVAELEETHRVLEAMGPPQRDLAVGVGIALFRAKRRLGILQSTAAELAELRAWAADHEPRERAELLPWLEGLGERDAG